MKISIIAAVAGKKRVLGKKGGLPWKIPGEQKRFKEITMGHPIIMGRKTFESIGRVLPGRRNIVITRDLDFKLGGLEIVHSLDEALKLVQGGDEIFIIGGGQIYEQSMSIADKLYLTVIENELEGDVFFPEYSDFNKIISEKSDKYEDYSFKFLELEKP